MRNCWRILICTAVLLLAGGCSVKSVYNNADRLARWSVSDYLDMDRAQRDYFDQEFAVFMHWHRTTQLPAYAGTLEALEAVTRDGTDSAEIQALFDDMFGWWEAIEQQGLPMVTELMLSLSDAQLARLPEKLAADNEELGEDEAGRSLEEIQEHWWREYTDGFSRFSGKLNSTQKAHVAAQSVHYIPQMALWTDYRRRWQADLLDLLRNEREDPEKFAAAFEALTKLRRSYYGAELTAVFAANERLARDVGVWLINNLNEKQKERFSERLLEYAGLFRELVAEAPVAPPEGGACLVRCPAAAD
ncbi:MAG: DUF6279 family lipoprotein [Pseudomonadales bacterium]|nr:hypothetical protein [Pseudomonadales bacterium]